MRNGVRSDYAAALKERLAELQTELAIPFARRNRTFADRWDGGDQTELWTIAS